MPSFFLQYKRTMQEEWRYFFMEYGLISHRAALNECYALDKDHLEIEIKTGYEVTEVRSALEILFLPVSSEELKNGAERRCR